MIRTSPLPPVSRRRLLTAMGIGAAAAVSPSLPLARTTPAQAATTDATCSAADTDEQEVGPFYVADGIVRSDITSGEDGVPLTFTITVVDSDTCAPLVGAAVDVWHASALGVYSDEASENTVGETYLRGIQITDADGKVSFTSIYPGWYAGRTNHIHVRIYTGGTVSGSSYDYSDATLIHTGQMFFDPQINATVAAVAPYTSNTVTRTTNDQDRVYTQQNGAEVLTTTTGTTTDGYTSAVSYTVSAASSGTSTTSLSLTASATEVRAGDKLTLSGSLTDSASGGLADKAIAVAAKLPSGKTVSTVTTTNAAGSGRCPSRPPRRRRTPRRTPETAAMPAQPPRITR